MAHRKDVVRVCGICLETIGAGGARGLCARHHQQEYGWPCEEAGCGRTGHPGGGSSRGLCPRCYQRKRRGRPPVSEVEGRNAIGAGKPLHVRIDAAELVLIEALAKERGQTVSGLVRELMQRELGRR